MTSVVLGQFGPRQNIDTNSQSTRTLLAGDLDSDGDEDLLVSAFNMLVWYENEDGLGTFSDIKIINSGYGQGFAIDIADLDNDTDLDIVYTSFDESLVIWYENLDGQGTFSGDKVISTQAPGANEVTTADLDGDGDLDVVIGTDFDRKIYWFENLDGAGDFGPIQLITNQTNSRSVRAADFDGDNDLDLVVSWFAPTNILWFENLDGLGNFGTANVISNADTNVSEVHPVDIDNDGDMDVYVGASSTSNGDSKLMRNNGDGTFTDVTAGSGVLAAQLGIENAPADFDNDGYVDILSNGDILFNNGDFTFANFANNVPPSGAIGDINNDGFLDVFRSGQIYVNNTNSNNWVKINTVGNVSNYNGIGARVELVTASGTQIRDVRSGEGFEFMSSLNTHFGIGTETSISSITIYWPSGIIDVVPNPTINTTHNIIEGSFLSIEDQALNDMIIHPNPVDAVLTIETSADVVDKIATVFDINGKRVLNLKLESNTLNVSSLESGIYFLRLESYGKTMKRKFIKK